MKMKASMILILVITAAAVFAFTANAQLTPVVGMPASTGFFTQGQVPAEGFAGGIQTAPGGIGTGQQQGSGIWIGEGQYLPTRRLPMGAPGEPTCQCIRAPCNCPPPSGPLPPANFPNSNPPFQTQPFQTQQFPAQPLQARSFQAQPVQPLSAPVGTAGNVAPGNTAPGTVQPRQF